MDQKLTGLSLLILAVIASGCGGNPGQTSGDAISIKGPQVSPNSIFAGSSARVSMQVVNTGLIESAVTVESEDSDGVKGREIMTNHCPDFFEISNFRARSSRVTDTQKAYNLKPEEKLQLNWELKQTGDNVPLNGYDCQLKFEVPFSYSVEAYKQLLVKTREAELEPKLPSKSSQGPLRIDIEIIGSTSENGAPVFLKGDRPEALIRIVNTQPSESSYQGLVELRAENLEITSSGVSLESDCLDDIESPISLYHGQSQIIRCNVNYDLGDKPSIKGEIRAAADYKYVRSVGERTLQVKYRGD